MLRISPDSSVKFGSMNLYREKQGDEYHKLSIIFDEIPTFNVGDFTAPRAIAYPLDRFMRESTPYPEAEKVVLMKNLREFSDPARCQDFRDLPALEVQQNLLAHPTFRAILTQIREFLLFQKQVRNGHRLFTSGDAEKIGKALDLPYLESLNSDTVKREETRIGTPMITIRLFKTP